MDAPRTPYGSVYFIQNTVSHRIYIGITIQKPSKRKAFHYWALRHGRHYNPHLQHAWSRYGVQTFEFGVLETVDSREALDEAEQFYIAYLASLGAKLYNQKDGGGFGGQPGIESRQRMSKAGKGRPKSEETRRRISEGSRGIKRAPTREGAARRVAGQRAAFQKPEYREMRRQAAIERYGNTYYLTSPDGTRYVTRALQTFCDEHGLSVNSARSVISGRMKYVKGWTVTVERRDPPE